ADELLVCLALGAIELRCQFLDQHVRASESAIGKLRSSAPQAPPRCIRHHARLADSERREDSRDRECQYFERLPRKHLAFHAAEKVQRAWIGERDALVEVEIQDADRRILQKLLRETLLLSKPESFLLQVRQHAVVRREDAVDFLVSHERIARAVLSGLD